MLDVPSKVMSEVTNIVDLTKIRGYKWNGLIRLLVRLLQSKSVMQETRLVRDQLAEMQKQMEQAQLY